MAVGWSRPKDDEPGHPDQTRKVTGVRFEPGGWVRVTLEPEPGEPVPYAPPDEVQDDVIEPTAVYKPWLPSTDWDNVEITVEYYD